MEPLGTLTKLRLSIDGGTQECQSLERKYCPLFGLWILIKNHMHGRGLIQMVTNLLLKC
ncbi:hypothetical protein Hanom_Chr05g00444031 [Helianthus anomalus]